MRLSALCTSLPLEGPSRWGGWVGTGVQVKGCFVLIWCYSERRSTDKGCLTPSEADTHGQPGGEDAGSERNEVRVSE